ncbi:MAG: phosphate-binding protein [Acidimicrobiia bacterium]|nr:phosphate-binding protein [Acidimicrobiia bacterium]
MALTLALALVVAACGGDDSTATTAGSTATTSGGTDTTAPPSGGDMSALGLPVIDPLDVPAGDIGIAGSSTVFPLSQAMVSQWIDEGGPEYPIDSIGSGGGFERFCVEGASDISNASRPIKDSEVESCQSIGREPIEIRVGTDALSVVISEGNYFAQNLTIEEIAAAFSAPDGATWDTVNSSFPAHEILAFSPGADSGTFDYFNEVVFDEAEPSPILSSGAFIVGEDDNATVNGVANDGCTEGDLGSTCAIGYFGFAFFQANADVLQAVAVDAGDGPIEPNADSVNANTYPIARPLFMYTDGGIVADKPQVAQFIAYYLNNVNDVISGVGYFPAPTEALEEAAANIAAAANFG